MSERSGGRGRAQRARRVGIKSGRMVARLGGGVALPTAVSAAVTALGTASTGTAISTLSGAAATKATLALLGGGTVAAGGLGVAGGTIVLLAVGAGGAVGARWLYDRLAKPAEDGDA